MKQPPIVDIRWAVVYYRHMTHEQITQLIADLEEFKGEFVFTVDEGPFNQVLHTLNKQLHTELIRDEMMRTAVNSFDRK